MLLNGQRTIPQAGDKLLFTRTSTHTLLKLYRQVNGEWAEMEWNNGPQKMHHWPLNDGTATTTWKTAATSLVCLLAVMLNLDFRDTAGTETQHEFILTANP
jgi:hypothetical protein